MMQNEDDILNEVLRLMDIKQFNIYLTNYNLQGMYERRKNHLVAKFFDGNVLGYSTAMVRIFNQFQTTAQEQRAKELKNNMYFLAQTIRNKKKYKQPHSLEVSEYNLMADEHNLLNAGVEVLISRFKKVHKPVKL